MREPVIVVGGGIAGLVLARRLARGGLEVHVLEQQDRVGGQVWRHTLDGVELDAAAESFATRDGAVAALLSELGLASDIVLPLASPAWVHRADGSAAPLPATGVFGIPGDPMAADVIAAIGVEAARVALEDQHLPADIGADALTLGELVRVRMGSGVLDGLVAPVVRGVHSRSPDELPLEVASPRLRALLLEHGSLAAAVRAIRDAAPAGSQVAGIRGGTFRLVDRLEAECEELGVRIRRGIRVDEILATGVRAEGEHIAGPTVLASADPTLPTPPPRRLTLVTLVVHAPQLDSAPRGTGVLVSADAPGVDARALTHLSAKWNWIAEALPGRHAVRLSYDGAPQDPLATARHDAQVLLGVEMQRIIDADVLAVNRPVFTPAAARTDSIPTAGEPASGTGLAAVIARAEQVAADVLSA